METIGGRDVATDVRAVPISVRVSFHNSLGKVTIQCLAFFLQFVFASLRLQRAASCRSVVKDSRFFLFQQACCLVCSSLLSTQTFCGLYCVNVQHLLCLHSCLDFVCHCLFRHFVLYAGHANRALLIDVHVYCISFQTNTDSGTDDSRNTLHVASTSNVLPRFGRHRFTTIQFVQRNKVGRALLLVPTSNTIHRIHICPSADASSVAIGVVVHVSASPKLFVVFVIWARFHHWTYLISK